MSPILIVLGTLGLLSMICLVRNFLVYKFRTRLLEALYKMDLDAIEAGWTGKPIYMDHLDDASYDEMVLKFWRSFKSFYPELAGLWDTASKDVAP